VFISLEGIDGSGKTTQAKLLAEALGENTLRLREPGGTELGEKIRTMLLDPSVPAHPEAELLLFLAARAQLVGGVIRQSLQSYDAVICDRYSDSTYAYQGAMLGWNVEMIEGMCDAATGGLWPDVTVLLRIDPELAVKRSRGKDRFESEGIEFQRGVAARYDELSRRHPERIRVVDAERDPETVHLAVLAEVQAVAA
jgi:dTMP kinase